MKNCRIRSLHQNPNIQKNPRKRYEFGFKSTFQLTFLSNYRFDFVYWYLSRKLHTCSGGFGWKIIYFQLWMRILIVRIFWKILWILITVYSKSTFYATTGLIFSIELPIDRFTFVEVDSTVKIIYFETCIGILIVRKFQYVLFILTYFDIRNDVSR